MDETCIQKFVESDPSGNGKYLDWMFLQAGGGQERLDRSTMQWEKGDHGEPPVKSILRDLYIGEATKGYRDEDGNQVAPVTAAVAEAKWEAGDNEHFRQQHIYGDEEYALTGFGFYREWPGQNQLYEQVIQAVQRFHRYQQKLKSMGKSIDLNAKNYPNLKDLLEALCDITVLEIKNHLDFDTLIDNEQIVVICPYNIGASIKFGHSKWCTANESMFKQAVGGSGPNRWKEYAKDSPLYYITFKQKPSFKSETPVQQIAIQCIQVKPGTWKFFDTADETHSEGETAGLIHAAFGTRYAEAWNDALRRIHAHVKDYPKSRLNLEFVVRTESQ